MPFVDLNKVANQLPRISPWSIHCITFRAMEQTFGSATPNNGAWPTANKAFLYPILLQVPVAIDRGFCVNGTTASGNLDIGIYDDAGNRLASTGSTAQSGTSVVQIVNLTAAIELTSGLYYMALAFNNTTAVIIRAAENAFGYRVNAGQKAKTSSFPLPDPITLTDTDANFTPWFGLIPTGVL